MVTDKEIPACNNTSAGVIVLKNDQLLLLERKKFPWGYACPAGHLEECEEFLDAARRELREETGLIANRLDLLYSGVIQNQCRRPGGRWHWWHLYQAMEITGELVLNQDEAKNIGWYAREQLRDLALKTETYRAGRISEEEWQKQPGLEPVWADFLKMARIV